jgi:adenine-specific DNA-methyltransferase
MDPLKQKQFGAYYTPDFVAESLLRWVIRGEDDRVLDPSCGDGRFISGHKNAVGIEPDPVAAHRAIQRAPWALVHEGDFFSWAENTPERFECAAGNPPFIRYQTFAGEARDRALRLCALAGARFSKLTSSWAPFLVATATLLKQGGRMAFVVPAEIGHAPYATPLLEYLVSNFAVVHIVAVRDKLFPELSEDCWLLYTEGFGQETAEIRFSAVSRYRPAGSPPRAFTRVPVKEWRSTWRCRLRPYLMDADARELYQEVLSAPDTRRLGEIARVGIGYVSGANEFFHLRPSDARRLAIPIQLLHPTVRNGRVLPAKRLTDATVKRWQSNDEPMLLLRINKATRELPKSVRKYLDSEAGHEARKAYKCRARDPWYSVPDVQVPDFFLSYMSGVEPAFVRNDAGCTCTNSVHSVRLLPEVDSSAIQAWESSFSRLSCEIEGHPLGGGMLKLEPREATQVALPTAKTLRRAKTAILENALSTMRDWRHCARTP